MIILSLWKKKMATGLYFCFCRFCTVIQLQFLCSLISLGWNHSLCLLTPPNLLPSSVKLLPSLLRLFSLGLGFLMFVVGVFFISAPPPLSHTLCIFCFASCFPLTTFGDPLTCHLWKIDCTVNSVRAGIGQQSKDTSDEVNTGPDSWRNHRAAFIFPGIWLCSDVFSYWFSSNYCRCSQSAALLRNEGSSRLVVLWKTCDRFACGWDRTHKA